MSEANKMPTIVVGQIVDIAEHSTFLELVSRVCFYDDANLNGDMLLYDENSLEKASSLVNMPVQAKYRVNKNGESTFGSHEMHRKKDGSIYFDTVSIGTHESVWIEEDNVDVNGTIKTLPCLFAKYRLWKRYPKMIEAAKRLFDENKLYSSWEMNTYQYLYDNGVRKILDYEFLSNCLLGYEYAFPSYGTSANAISMAQLENKSQLMIAEALSQDLIENNNKEENTDMAEKIEPIVAEEVTEVSPVDTEPTIIEDTTTAESAEGIVETEENEPVVDSAQLTTYDLRRKISEACRAKMPCWCYVNYMFPNEKEVWCEYDNAPTELDYVKFTYEVGADDTVTVSEPEYVKLTVSIAEVNSTIAALHKEIETVKAELDIKNDAITKASETIQDLNVQISELTPFKEQVEIAEQKRIEAEIAEEKERLKSKMLKGNLFTEAEIQEPNIAELIEARNESAINSLIADKFVASFDIQKNEETTVAEVTLEETVATASLESDEDDTDVRSFMGKILF